MNSTKECHDDYDPIWYPFTQMSEFENKESPLTIVGGEGNYLFDEKGKKYLDGVSSLWTNVHGHNHPHLNKALIEQIQKISHTTLLGLSNDKAIELGKKLIKLAPKGLSRVFYSDSGSTSVEVALKMAYQYFQQKGRKEKKKFLTLKESYHGDTLGSVSVGGIDLFHKVYRDLLFHTIKLPSPHCYRCPYGKDEKICNCESKKDKDCFKDLEDHFKKYAHEACAFVIEPLVQGAAGIFKQPENYLKTVRKLCDEYEVFMIADEVAVGFGKTGHLFACEKDNVVPDILCLAKGISGGYLPLAATLVKEEIYKGFLGDYAEFKSFFHGHTYTGNALACSVALANLELFEDKNLNIMGHLQEKILYLKNKLEPFKDLLHVGSLRQEGIIVGIELVLDKNSKIKYDPELRVGHEVILKAREKGLMLRPLGDIIVLMPPLSIQLEEIDFICEVLYDILRDL